MMDISNKPKFIRIQLASNNIIRTNMNITIKILYNRINTKDLKFRIILECMDKE